uniref:Hapless 8 n=1 Tax=Davidia involucrata TaxID=16924 RepID=A0A5B6Z1G7_DAVIN
MLSIENPPPDPPCPCEISQLRSSDERASDKVALEDVDLLNSALDDNNNNPLPKFSIRDYVFGARSKDINTNWPFSQKNLQLCLRHGVKDLLPPFQLLDSVRNRSVKSAIESTSLLDKEYIGNSDGKPSRPSDHFDTVSSDDAECNKKLAVEDSVNINSSGSEGEKEFPSTTTSQISQFEADSVTPCPALETDTSPEAAAASLKKESAAQPPVKKCRLIVKLGNNNNTDPCSNEDIIMSNYMAFSETMASKVCPVCKTFSSSSNTTLNAHIDQCLSVESTVNWTANAKVIKHRIKPRKTRLMVDIYTTASPCTLEDLDRRNGTNWATNLSMPAQEITGVLCSEERKQGVSPVNLEGTGDEGAVYIDANGRKLRILSKFNESPVSEAVVSPGSRKLLKGGKGSKFLSSNKKKGHAQKHQKYLKLAPQSKNFCSLKPHRGSEIRRVQERNFAVEENHRKEERLMQPFKAQKQIKPGDSGTIRKWASSKRTGLSKKVNCKEGLHRLEYNLRQDLLVESDQSSLGDSYVERSCVLKTPNSSESPPSSPESIKSMENSSYEARGTECNEQPPLRKRVGFSSFGSHISGNMERSLEILKRKAKQSRKDSTSVYDSCKVPPNYRENHVSFHSNKPVEINAGPVKNTDSSRVVCSKPSQSHHVFLSKGTRFPSLSKNVLSVKRSSVPKTNYHLNRKCLSLRKSQVHGIAEVDEVEAAWPSEGVEQHDSMQNLAEDQSRVEDITNKMSLGSSVLKIRKKRRATTISQREEFMALKSSHSTSQCYGHVGENVDSSARVFGDLADAFDDIESAGKGLQTHGGNIVIEPSSRIAVGGSVMSSSKSSDPEFHKLASPSYTRPASLRYVELYKGSFCGAEAPICLTEPSLGDGQEIFCADEVGNGVIRQSTHTGAELDSKVGQGNYFPEVDPIPIPGPPGSFLPSPRDMGSEDLQGNSSLTTSRVQSSEDHHDTVDGDSSDSPISATSTISNSAMVISDSKFSEKLFVGPDVAQDDIRSGFSSASHDLVAENTGKVSDAASVGTERKNPDELKVNVIVSEKGPLSFKNDQPCCCSRKEGTSHGFALNYQDSQLLRRRSMALVHRPDMGKQMSYDPNRKPNNLNSRSEMFTLSNFPSSGSEKVVLPVTKSPAGSIPMNVSADPGLEFHIRGDCDSASPSTSNPILRLMGKNLMVVNKDEDVSPPLCEAQSGALNDHPNPPFRTLSGVSPGIVQNGDFHSFHHMFHQGPLIFGQNQHNTLGQGFDVRLSNSFRSHVNFKTPQTPSHTPVAMFPSKIMGGDSTASLELHEYKGGYNLPSDQNRPKNRPDKVTHNMVDHPHKNADSTNSVKEIIIIDDTPESEANSATDATYTEGMRGSRVTSAGISIPMAADYNSRHANPFHSYQPQDSSPYGVSPMVHNASFQMPPYMRANASPVKWNCTKEGSSVLHPSSLTASSSSTGHLRSALYYSPSFS